MHGGYIFVYNKFDIFVPARLKAFLIEIITLLSLHEVTVFLFCLFLFPSPDL